MKKFLVLLIFVGIGLLITIPAFSSDATTKNQATDTVGVVGASAGISTAINQGIAWVNGKKQPESPEPESSGYSLLGHHYRLETLEKEIKTQQRRIKHLENTLIRLFPDSFNPKDTI